jgi:molybdopterin molybdotransferase
VTSVAQAEAEIMKRMGAFEVARLPLADVAGLVLRETVFAERDQPPFDRITMDGIAIAYADWRAGRRRFRCAGVQGAGSPPLTLAGPGECIEVMTGTMLPHGADTVIPVENIRAAGATREVLPATTASERQYVHARGSDRPAGNVLIPPGRRIGAAEIAVLASAGYAEVTVTKPPRIAVVSTGDELVDVDAPLAPYQIRSTNDRAIEASLARGPLASVTRTRLSDDRESLLNAIRALHANHDVLILSGGVSKGQYDFVPSVLEEIGAKPVFHRVEQRPGKPLWFGIASEHKPVFALPGNPVSTLVCLTRYVRPALDRAMGLECPRSEYAKLDTIAERSATLTYFMPVRLSSASNAVLMAEPRPTNTSGDFVSLIGTDGFVELPPGENPCPAGTVARLFRW